MGVTKQEVTVYVCERCEHQWIPRDPFTDPGPEDLPKVCPKCKSPYWNTLRRSDAQAAKPAAKKKVRKKSAK